MKKMDLDGPVSNTEGGVLAQLWRNIIKDNNLESFVPHMVTRYVGKANKLAPKQAKLKAKSTILSNINAKAMTWKTFLDLVFNFLGAVRVDVTVKVTFANGDETYHTITADNSANEMNEVKEEKK